LRVADTTVAYDRDIKMPLHARAGVPEAWLVDLLADVITVYRTPGREGYGEIATVTRGETLRPLFVAGVAIGAVEILG